MSTYIYILGERGKGGITGVRISLPNAGKRNTSQEKQTDAANASHATGAARVDHLQSGPASRNKHDITATR